MSTNSSGLPVTYITDPGAGYAPVYLVNTSVSAAGADQGSATALPVNGFVTVNGATGTNGVILPSSVIAGTVVVLQNNSASALLVYPQSGGTVNGAATDASVSVPANSQASFLSMDGTAWSAAITGPAGPQGPAGPAGPPGPDTNILRVDPAFVVPLPGGYALATRDWYSTDYQFYDCTPSGSGRGLVLPGGVATGTVIYLYNGATNDVTAYADTLTSDVVWSGDGSTTAASGTVPATAIAIYVKVDATHWAYTIYVGSNVGGGGTTDATARSTANAAYTLAQTGTNAAATAQSTGTAAYTLAVAGTNAAAAALTPLSASRTYYVSTTGNDSNNGLTVGTPFLTIQKAIDVVSGLYVPLAYTVTIQLADGTYSQAASLSFPPLAGGGYGYLKGNAATPANVTVNSSASVGNVLSFRGPASTWFVQDLTLASAHGASLIRASFGGNVFFTNMIFGATSLWHLRADFGGIAFAIGNYSITGAAAVHAYCEGTGSVLSTFGSTVTITGTPAWSTAFVQVGGGGSVRGGSMVFVGSATGKRYDAYLNGVVNTGGGGANYFPGNVAGTTSTGGQYA